jgi:hypothetical protein
VPTLTSSRPKQLTRGMTLSRALAWRMPDGSGHFDGMSFREIEEEGGADTLCWLYRNCQAADTGPGSPEETFIEVFELLTSDSCAKSPILTLSRAN